MSTLTQDVLVAAFENHPPMLEKGSYDTWQSRLLMYVEGKENVQMYLNSILMKQIDCDIMATNIVFQGLPNDIHALLNNKKIANSILNRVKELIDGI
ncbi:hypothetical protein Tco_0089894 [Tanacetum coccineum]